MDTHDNTAIEKTEAKPILLRLKNNQEQKIDIFMQKYNMVSKSDAIRYLIGLGLEQIETGGKVTARLERLEQAFYEKGII